jgi:hypothetical protein
MTFVWYRIQRRVAYMCANDVSNTNVVINTLCGPGLMYATYFRSFM